MRKIDFLRELLIIDGHEDSIEVSSDPYNGHHNIVCFDDKPFCSIWTDKSVSGKAIIKFKFYSQAFQECYFTLWQAKFLKELFTDKYKMNRYDGRSYFLGRDVYVVRLVMSKCWN